MSFLLFCFSAFLHFLTSLFYGRSCFSHSSTRLFFGLIIVSLLALSASDLQEPKGSAKSPSLTSFPSLRAENRTGVPGCTDKSLGRISLFFRLHGLPGSPEDHILYHQQTLGTSCLPWPYPHRVSCQAILLLLSRAGSSGSRRFKKKLRLIGYSA